MHVIDREPALIIGALSEQSLDIARAKGWAAMQKAQLVWMRNGREDG